MERPGDWTREAVPVGTVFVGRVAHPPAAPDGQVPTLTAAWYAKPEATFSDCLIFVRKHLWRSLNYVNSAPQAESVSFPAPVWEHWLSCLAGAA